MSETVFVSYARQDEAFVLRLASDLKARGISVWLDQWAVTPGADWDQSIDRAIAESPKIVAILSPAAVASKQVRAELQLAVDAPSKTVYPVLYQDCEVPRVLRLYQFLDFRDTRKYDRELDRLARALGAETGPPKPAPPPSPSPRRGGRLILAAIVAAIIVGGGGILLYRADEQLPHQASTGGAVRPIGPTGTLQVNVNVDAARVRLDGTDVGSARQAVPLILKGITAGQHQLRVEADGYLPEERWVSITANDWTSEGFVLHRQ